jgi:hypothetical protein
MRFAKCPNCGTGATHTGGDWFVCTSLRCSRGGRYEFRSDATRAQERDAEADYNSFAESEYRAENRR